MLHLSHFICLFRCLEPGGGHDLRRHHRVGLLPLLGRCREPHRRREKVSRISSSMVVVAITKNLRDVAWKGKSPPLIVILAPAHFPHVLGYSKNLPIIVVRKAVEIPPDYPLFLHKTIPFR